MNDGEEASDILDPTRGERLREQAACVIIMKGDWPAFEAEMLSTGLLAMGRERAGVCCQRLEQREADIAWVDRVDGRTRLNWLGEAHE